MDGEETLLDSNVKVHCLHHPSSAFGTGTDKILRFLVKKLAKIGSHPELCLRITDDGDPLLLYSCNLNEADYRNLQHSQGLLVDFTAFPHHLVSLVNQCSNEAVSSSPKFTLLLRENPDPVSPHVSLEILEINVFRHLCHFQLHLIQADLQTKLSHLSDCISAMKMTHTKETQALRNQESNLLGETQRLKNILKEQQQKFDQLKRELEAVTYRSGQQQAHIQSAEKEKFLKFQSDLERKTLRERKELEEKFSKQLSNQKLKVDSLTQKINDVIASRNQLQEALRHSEDRSRHLEREHNLQHMELAEMKKRKNNLEHEAQSHYEAVHRLEAENAHLQMEAKAASELRQELSAIQQQKNKLEEALGQSLEKVKKREEKVAHVFQELQKSWQVIEKIQGKLKNSEKKVADLETKASESTVLLSVKEKQVIEAKENVRDLEEKLSQEKAINITQKAELDTQTAKVQEIEATLRTKENVISWLKKQLSEAETSGDIMKKAPLGEAYLGQSNNYSDLPSSTPLSGGTKPQRQNLGLSAVKPGLPEISEENKSDDKENKGGIDAISTEKQTVPKRIGLIRSSAISKQPSGPSKPGLVLPKQQRTKKKTAYFNSN